MTRGRIDWAPWSYLWTYYRGRRGAVALLAVLGALQSAIFLPTLYAVKYAFDHAVPKGQIALLIWIGLALVVFRLFGSAVALGARLMTLKTVKGAVCEMRRDLIATLYALPRDFFGKNDAARVQTRVVMETERIDNLSGLILSTMLPALLTTAFLTAVLVHLNVWLVALLAALVPLIWVATYFGGRYVKREVRAFQKAFEGFSHGVQFVLRQMDLTRARGYEDAELDRQTKRLRHLETSGVRMAMSYAVHGQLQTNLNGIGGLLLLVGGGIAVAQKVMSLGDLMAFYLAAGAMNAAMSRLTGTIPDLIAGAESLRTLLTLRGQAVSPGYQGKAAVAFTGAVAIRNVSFAYDEKPVLRGVSLDLQPGSRTAIVGSNGAGKSTIINLILGFYRPQAGELTAEGTPYGELDLRALRRRIGLVPQKPTFFTGTVAENLVYGWPEVSPEAVERALDAACAKAFIAKLPDGLDTVIGEGGALISGGEAQRLAIARALIGDPKLLILDEPTNHLDAEAIEQIMGRITRNPDHAGILIISHDKTVVGFADQVLRLEAGLLKPVTNRPVPAPTA